MTIPVVYDPRYMQWDQWAALMVEAYGAQNLEIPGPEDTWKGWAAGFKGIDIFTKDGVPDPYQFEDWQSWATALVNIVTAPR